MKKMINFQGKKFLLLLLITIIASLTGSKVSAQKAEKITSSWNSIKNHATPQWLKDGKFGIYTHWGIYSVPAQDISFTIKDHNLYVIVLNWPDEKLLVKSLAPKGDTWAGLYPSEISSVTMLGDGKELKWKMTKEGLEIEPPKTKPCDYAFAIKIVRRKPF